MASDAARAVGVDIGGTGIKAGIVDLDRGELISDRVKVATPAGAQPPDVLAAVTEVLSTLGVADDQSVPLGVAFPAIVKHGRTLSAANVSEQWIDFEAEKFFEDGLGRDIHFANDADVAGVAEVRYGAAKDQAGPHDPHHARHRDRLRAALQRRARAELRARARAAREAREGCRGVRGLLGDGARRASPGSSGPSGCSGTTATSSSCSAPTSSSSAAASPSTPTSSCTCSSSRRRSCPAVHRNNAGIIGAAALARRPVV